MENKNLVVELGVEEIPAQYIKTMANSYEENAKKILREINLSYKSLQVLYTTRRLVLIVKNLLTKQLDKQTFVKGPSVKVAFESDGKTPSRALIGFLNKNNKQVEDIIIEQDYVCLKYLEQGKTALEVLPSAIEKLIALIYNPNPMRWNVFKIKFIRPIRWVLSMLGNDLIPVHLECVDSGSFTFGHRTLCNKKVEIIDCNDYERQLQNLFVILDQNKRKQMIVDQLNKIEKEHNFDVEIDKNLLEEITNILEYPTCALGRFDEIYLNLPECVIKSPLKEQQRYFAVYKNNKLTNNFVFVRDGGSNFLENVIKGNERVLRPRLADAEFFFANDLKSTLLEKAEQLSEVVFVEKAGSYFEKSRRVETIAKLLAKRVEYDISEQTISLSAKLMKADLVSSVVREYTNIQGEIGAILAEKEGYASEICTAIKEQYLPNFQGDKLPSTKPSAIISIADKLDTIFSLCAVGLKPTSSSDPYGLRRQILGIFLIALDQEFDVDFDKFIEECAEIYKEFLLAQNESIEDFTKFVKEFFHQRLKVFLNEVKNYKQEELAQVALSELNIYKSILKLDTIRNINNTEWFNGFVNIYNRILKLIKNFDCNKLNYINNVQDAEAEEMVNMFIKNKQSILNNIKTKNYEQAIKDIALCGKEIDKFMATHLALCEDENKKNNRVVFFNEFCAVCGLILTL